MGYDDKMSGGAAGRSDDLSNPYAEDSLGPPTGDRSIGIT